MIVNLSKYPIDKNNTSSYSTLVDQCRIALNKHGLCVLPNFIEDNCLQHILAETKLIQKEAFHQTVVGNAYLKEGDPSFSKNHPVNRTDTTSLGVIAYDQIPTRHLISDLYHNQLFINFIENCIDRGPLYKYKCPLGAINIAVMNKEDHLRWHFDQSDFVVSIPLQSAEIGGEYQYIKNIRTPYSENYEAIESVLNDSYPEIQVLDTPPGSLVLFEGKYTIHRVTKVEGKKSRLVALLGYVMDPEITSTKYLRKIRYGREN